MFGGKKRKAKKAFCYHLSAAWEREKMVKGKFYYFFISSFIFHHFFSCFCVRNIKRRNKFLWFHILLSPLLERQPTCFVNQKGKCEKKRSEANLIKVNGVCHNFSQAVFGEASVEIAWGTSHDETENVSLFKQNGHRNMSLTEPHKTLNYRVVPARMSIKQITHENDFE